MVFLHSADNSVNLPNVESKDGCENPKSDASQEFGSPRIAVRELEDAVQRPHTIEQHDEGNNGLA